MAEEDTKPPAEEQDDVDALETPEDDVNALETKDGEQVTDATGGAAGTPAPAEPPHKGGIKKLLQRFNIYLLFFILILVVAGIIIAVAYFQSKKAVTTSTLKTQNLTQDLLKQVANSDAEVGSSQQILNVQSSAVFAGKVLVRQGLEIASNLQVGGTTTLKDLNVTGASQFGQVQVSKDLSVTGNTAVQGTLTAKGLQVNGSGSFSGTLSAPQVTTSNLQLNGDLVLTHHLIVGGGTPGRSNGSALGSGGTASVGGSDTAGSVSINTGGSPGAGCFVTINFTSKYGSTPHILLTPVGSAGGSIDYYVNRTTTSFSICSAGVPPAGASFGFDYFVVD